MTIIIIISLRHFRPAQETLTILNAWRGLCVTQPYVLDHYLSERNDFTELRDEKMHGSGHLTDEH